MTCRSACTTSAAPWWWSRPTRASRPTGGRTPSTRARRPASGPTGGLRRAPGRRARGGGLPLGELADVVVAPRSRHITHVVVRPHAAPGLARLAPIDAIEPGDDDALVLR